MDHSFQLTIVKSLANEMPKLLFEHKSVKCYMIYARPKQALNNQSFLSIKLLNQNAYLDLLYYKYQFHDK